MPIPSGRTWRCARRGRLHGVARAARLTNRAIRDGLATLFVVLFVVLVARQVYVQIVSAPSHRREAAQSAPALLDANRGRILATDGSVLAQTVDGHARLSAGRGARARLGYVSVRYGTSGLEAAYDRALTPADTTGDPLAQLAEIRCRIPRRSRTSRRAPTSSRRSYPDVQRELFDQLSKHARGAGVVIDPRTRCGARDRQRAELRSERARRELRRHSAPTRIARCSTARSTGSIRPARPSRSLRPARRSTRAPSRWIRTFDDPGLFHDRQLHAAQQRRRSHRVRRRHRPRSRSRATSTSRRSR